jgi:hypothetical protein
MCAWPVRAWNERENVARLSWVSRFVGESCGGKWSAGVKSERGCLAMDAQRSLHMLYNM